MNIVFYAKDINGDFKAWSFPMTTKDSEWMLNLFNNRKEIYSIFWVFDQPSPMAPCPLVALRSCTNPDACTVSEIEDWADAFGFEGDYDFAAMYSCESIGKMHRLMGYC